MAHRKSFYLYKRKKTQGSYWYVCYLDPETGVQGNAKSIDVLKDKLGLNDNKAIKHRDDAAIIANKALEAGLVFSEYQKVLFADYCDEFWDFETSNYVKMRNNVKPNSLGIEYCKNMQINFRKHVYPYLPAHLMIQNVTTRHLDAILKKIYAENRLSSGTIQLIVLSFSQPLKEALRLNIICKNPAEKLMPIARSEQKRGVFTLEECKAFCAKASELFEKGLLYPSYYYALITAISTGMRSGEIRALNAQHLLPNALTRDDGVILDKIVVEQSLAPYSGVKCTKGKYSRELCIPHDLGEKLLGNQDKKGLLFPSRSGGYISSPTLLAKFLYVLEEMGISKSDAKSRNLTFHSLRHAFATLGRDASLSKEDRMLVLGHRSERVNERYTHITAQQLERVSFATSNIINYF